MIQVLLVSSRDKLKHFCTSLTSEDMRIESLPFFPAEADDIHTVFSLILFDFLFFEHGHVQKCHSILQRCGDVPIIALVSEKNTVFAPEILKSGVTDIVVFPCCPSYLTSFIRHHAVPKGSVSTAADTEQKAAPEESEALSRFIGISHSFTLLKNEILLAATNDMPVLLLGETGTGKSRAARLIHDLSQRRHAPFIEENIAAVQETLVEGELFGTKAGAYTGAVTRPGLFEKAAGGTLFLDEIGCIGLNIQAKLLRILETGEFRRVGDSESKRFDVRIICATNSPLSDWKDSGRFRKDLYYRITGLEVHIPPLSKRKEDILPLARSFLEKSCRTNNKAKYLSRAAEHKLLSHHWPGNIRELQNCVTRAFYASCRNIISDTDIDFVL